MMHRNISRTALWSACCVLAACASEPALYQATMAPQAPIELPPPVTIAPVPAAAGAADSRRATPLDYYEWALRATPEELAAERLRLSTRRSPADAVVDSVHLGMLLSVSAIASRETEREAKELLESVGEATDFYDASREYAIFADLLLNDLEQREKLREVTTSMVESREELETLERTNAELQETIEALTSIEEQLIEREQAQQQEQEPQ